MRQNPANVFFTLCAGRLVAPPLADWFSPVYCLHSRSAFQAERAKEFVNRRVRVRLMCPLRYALADWSHRRWPIGSRRFIASIVAQLSKLSERRSL